jgi:hypothetical protein
MRAQRVAAVLSQVVHFLSDLLASGASLSSDKNAPPLPLAYASTVLTRFLQAFAHQHSSSASSHTSNASFKLSPSPHCALVDSASSSTAHASTSTLIGTSETLPTHAPTASSVLAAHARGSTSLRRPAARALLEP